MEPLPVEVVQFTAALEQQTSISVHLIRAVHHQEPVARSVVMVSHLCLFQFHILKSESVPHLKAVVELHVQTVVILHLYPSRI